MDIQTLLNLLALISIPIGVFYHIMTLSNTNKNQRLTLETRQAQLGMQIVNQFSDPKIIKSISFYTRLELNSIDEYLAL